jgi:AhpD family alkylhydroperoxidase
MGAMSDGTLDKKSREFIALAIAVTQRCTPCINLHIEALIKASFQPTLNDMKLCMRTNSLAAGIPSHIADAP